MGTGICVLFFGRWAKSLGDIQCRPTGSQRLIARFGFQLELFHTLHQWLVAGGAVVVIFLVDAQVCLL